MTFILKKFACFFDDQRSFEAISPKGVAAIELKDSYTSKDKLSNNFIQYIVNLKADRSFARDEGDEQTASDIDAWFEYFENRLRELFESDDLRLNFDRKNYNFNIQIGNSDSFSLNQLSAGYSAAIDIIAEIIMRMEMTGSKIYDLQGVVLIDEIENHLHVALQKKIMPFLTAFFPNVQFIVTTHSPFVLSSISNAVICDLERREVVTDLSGYSYDALIETYFDTDKYSKEVKEKIAKFELLVEKESLNDVEKEELYELKRYFNDLPTYRADELAVAIQQIKLKMRARQG